MRPLAGALPLALLWAAPLAAGLALVAAEALDIAAWRALFDHPQLWPALALSLSTGAIATAAALLLTLIICAGLYRSSTWNRLQPALAAGLSVPHLAFAVGFGFLIMPSGALARLVAGGDAPPQWITTQDPHGLSLAVALALKEVPFLLAMAWSVLAQGDAAPAIDGQWRAALSLGHGPCSAWLRIVQPQLLRRMAWSIAIVFFYGATVVDMALAIGPTQPPTLAVVVWRDLNDAATAVNARGLAGALLLSLASAGLAGLALASVAAFARATRPMLAAGPSPLAAPRKAAMLLTILLALTFLAAIATLAVRSTAVRWPYPSLVPAVVGIDAWHGLVADPSSLWLSCGLGIASAVTALALCVTWFESTARKTDRWLVAACVASLTLPQLVVAAGQYRLFLATGLDGSLAGLFLAHLTPTLAYAAIVLAGPYRSFDGRYMQAARSLSAAPLRAFLAVKLPLLKAPLFTALAVGFSVSMVQFVPAQLVAAGRHETLPMAAVALASGGNRPLAAVFALALALPPLLAFALALRLGRPRWG